MYSAIACVTLLLMITVPSLCEQHVIYERCMRGKYHKVDPGPEPELVNCGHFRNKACCTNDTTASLRDEDALYKFNYSHCAPMSSKCQQLFLMNNCFYECSPNVWPWITPIESSYRNERYKEVPLCQSNCNAWWEACREESTCVVNWSTGFTWANKVNECPVNNTCQKFEQVYSNATYFCENIWGPKDYKVVPDYEPKKPCLSFIYTNNVENLNNQAADFYAKEKELICDKSDLKSQIEKLNAEVILLGTFLGITLFIFAFAVVAYYRHAALPEVFNATYPPHRLINLSQVYRSGNDGSAGSSDSKVSFVNNLHDEEREVSAAAPPVS